MVEVMFAKRQAYKKKMIELQKEYEKVSKINPNDPTLNQISFDIAKFNNLQNAMKLCLNSLYGCLGTKYFRFFDVRQAEAITLEGQLSNRWVANKINEYLNKILNTDKDYVIGGDTDSLFLSLHGLVKKVCPPNMTADKIVEFLLKSATVKIQPEIDNFCNELTEYVNSYDNKLKYKLEKICSNSVFVAKKRYALNVYSNEGVVYNEPKIKVTGLEIVKSSSPAVVRKALKDCVKLILDEDKAKLQNFVTEFRAKFNKFSVEEIAFPRGVNGLNKYHDSVSIYKKGTPIHVRGSMVFNNAIKEFKLNYDYEFIKDGDKIKYCYLKLPNSMKENVIAFPERLPKELDLHKYVDYDMMWDKVFLEPLKSITEIIRWDLEKKNYLEDFF
jgi:DNA polymerase elongation subunit (family B)